MTVPCLGRWGTGQPITLDGSGTGQKIIETGGNLVGWILQNQGPGKVYYGPNADVKIGAALRLNPDDSVWDSWPYVHGETIYAVSDQANTVVVVVPITPMS